MRKISNTCFLVLWILFPFNTISARDLSSPIDLHSAKVLPVKVRNLRFKDVQVRGNTKYSPNGTTIDLSDPFFKTITFNDLIELKNADPVEKGKLQGFLKARNFKLDDTVGSTTGAVSVAAEGRVPIIAWGITPQITMALAIPVIKYAYSVDSGFLVSSEGNRLQKELQNSNRVYEVDKLEEKLQDPIATKLEDFNYLPLRNERGQKLGDIKLVTKYQIFNAQNYLVALQNELTLPTGKQIDINKVVDVPGGDGKTDIGMSIIGEYYPLTELTFSVALGYTWQTPHHLARRIPYRQDSKLSPDIDTHVKRDIGNISFMQTGVKYQWEFGLNTLIGYTFQYKNRDTYRGNLYESYRYEWMSADTIQRMHNLTLGLGISTIPLFQAKKFPIPMEANIVHSRLMAGKNVTKDPTTTLELALYF